MTQKEISILSKILQLIRQNDYEDSDDFPVKISRIYSNCNSKKDFINESNKLKTTFFKKNKLKKSQFFEELLKNLSKEKFLEDHIFPKQLFIDEIDNFKKVIVIKKSKGIYLNILEESVKKSIKKIIGEYRVQKDWGGEQSDLFTTKLVFNGKRIQTAICLKGRSKKGTLQISDCGKNGDQIIRLFKEPAKLFIWQYVGDISSQIYDLMETCAYKKSEGGINEVYYCIIDGADTERLLKSYSPNVLFS